MRSNYRVWLASFVMVCLSGGCGANHLTTTSTTPMMSSLKPPPQPPPPAPVIVNGTKKSIRNWVTCDGVTDDSLGVAQAFDAAKNNAFILEVDCPVFMHVGMDTTRTVFIDNGTQVDFSAAGLIILDNILVPSFVIADTNNVTLTNWNVKYVGNLPINPMGQDGEYPAATFSGMVLTHWLTANRDIKFIGQARAAWPGFVSACAIFYLAGSTSNIDVEEMNVWVPQNAGGDHYVPMVFTMQVLQTANQTVTTDVPLKSPYYAMPSNLTFSGITLDGTYMGWQGNAADMRISNVVSYRYGDLQDAHGENVGGNDDWFAPPHLFYLNYLPNGDPSLFNRNIVIENVVDYGQRVGNPRDTNSGNCYSLKLGAYNGSVSNYVSFRPDGFMDVLWSTGLTLTNITASYDSSFLHGTFPIIRFPGPPYHDVTFTNVKLQDTAENTDVDPIWGSNYAADTNIIFNDTEVSLNQWTGNDPPGYSPTVGSTKPYFAGIGNNVDIQYAHQ